MAVNELRANCETAGQDHLFQFWDELDSSQKDSLVADISRIDFQSASECLQKILKQAEKAAKVVENLEQPDVGLFGGVARNNIETLEDYKQIGLAAIGNNEVAALLLAGGQGTRLGSTYPKGMYDIGLPSGKSLFQLHAERILRLQQLAELSTGKTCCIPWYIMTSDHTRKETASFLAKNSYFGLKKENVLIFEQMSLPCFDLNGKILMASKANVAWAPAGNGDMYRAMREEGILADLLTRGVKFVHVHLVENVLLKIADPMFVGFCIRENLSLGAKITEKTAPYLPMSVVCKANGTYRVLHYHELSPDLAEQRDQDGKLMYRAGIVGDLMYTTEFLKSLCKPEHESLMHYHAAKKAVPYIDSSGQLHQPIAPNAIKLEKFLFDDFNFQRKLGAWEVAREDEFSPLKNNDVHSSDSPTTCRNDLFDLHRRYVLAAGGKFHHSEKAPAHGGLSGGKDTTAEIVEISPLVSYAGEGLENLVKGKVFDFPVVFELDKRTESNLHP